MSKIFEPISWCKNPHLQTIISAFMVKKPKVSLNRRRIELTDGDFIDVDFMKGSEGKPLVIILPGVEGSSRSHVVLNLLSALEKIHWKAAAINYRGCSGEPNRLAKNFHGGSVDDLQNVINNLRERKGSDQIYIVGFSLGGNILLKWLGMQGHDALKRIQKAVAISVPYDLSVSSRQIDSGLNWLFYTLFLMLKLKKKLKSKKKLIAQDIGAIHYNKIWTFKAYDRYLTARLNNFKDEHDYWYRSSCLRTLSGVHVPTLLIHAKDDPFFPGQYLPYEKINLSRSFRTLFTEYGGHLGFLSGKSLRKKEDWLEEQIIDFLSQ